MYFVKTPPYLKRILPGATWDRQNTDEVYLTFDDGPVAGVTDSVLDLLAAHKQKATFFCIGDNVRRNPGIYERIRNEGHAIGNHTYHHVNGWRTPLNEYLNEVEQCRALVDSRLFRPPYGRITLRQLNRLKPDYNVVMWDVLSGDFDPTLDGNKCAQNVIHNLQKGSIVVFHDSEKAAPRMLPALEKVLTFLHEQGLSGGTL